MSTHDPYLITASRSLNDEKIKKRKQRLQQKNETFLSQNIDIRDYIYIPESLQTPFLLSMFLLIPYVIGTIVLFSMIIMEVFKEQTKFGFDAFMLNWTIGYETIALFLLLLIIKSSFSFKKRH